MEFEMGICRVCGFTTAMPVDGHRYITSNVQQVICNECVKKIVQQARIRHIEP